MTGPGANLPEDILSRIEAKKREAIETEIRSLEEAVSRGIDAKLADRRARLEELSESRKREAEESSVRELAELQAFGEATLRRLDAELLRRRAERQKDEAARREARLLKEKQEEEKKRLAEEEAKKRKAAADDPAHKIRTIIRHAQAHVQRGDMEIAAKTIAEGLEIDGFNAELLDLDAKVREAMASDTFGAAAAPSPDARKGKDKAKAKAPKAKKPKAPPPAPHPAGAAPGAPASRRFPSWAFTVIAAALIAGAALIAWLEYRPKAADQGMTIAVLPWNTPAGASDLRVFGEALPEIVVRLLSSGQSATGILGYTTTAGLASFGPDPVSSLVRLGYSHFLRGTLSRRDSTFSLRIELTDSSGTVLWSTGFERDTAGLFLVPFEISHGLRDHLREQSTTSAGTAVVVKNTDAYVRYLAGLNALRRPGDTGVDEAVVAFSGAVAVDSALAESHAGLAAALVAKHLATEPGSADLLEDARAAASKSILLSPRSAEGYFAMSRVLIERRDFPAAIALLDSAAVLSPSDSRLPFLRGLAFFRSGRHQQALDALQKAYTIDPRNAALLELLATVHQLDRSFERALWFRETAMHFSGDTLKYLIGPFSDVIIHDPALALSNGRRVTSACMTLLQGDPYEYTTLYSLARTLQGSGDLEESLTYFNGLETSLRARIKQAPTDTRARMYLALTLTRLGRYADGTAIGEAAAAADTNNIEAKYLLARIYALQMYSPQTKTVDGVKQTRAMDLLKQALLRRFVNDQICSADLYNVYNHGDIRSLLQ